MKSYSVEDAAEVLGISGAGVRQRIHAGTLKGKKEGTRWVVYLNGDEPVAPQVELVDPLTEIADEFIALGKRLKKAVKEHDEYIRRETILDIGNSLTDSAGR